MGTDPCADPAVHDVLAAEQARAAALVARDASALGALLDADLVYVHATGVRHDRRQLLQFVEQGPRFLAVALEQPSVSVFGEVALVVGELRLTLQREAAATEARSWASEVWARAADGRWRLRLFQSTRIPT